MRPASNALNMRKVMVLAVIALLFLPMTGADSESPDKARTVSGGHAILFEQLTATWCDTCATIDPWITDFVIWPVPINPIFIFIFVDLSNDICILSS